ncbi:phage protein Gp27 family protein [Thalassococcus sp. S3]|uniref:phage protein Gp27 family protein n=1 Tax=Thalassococcus sp. S3 TaxID=2017482 RepID=UPI0010242492|nr:phage protein Gp27 family protein [Thalassococcus sp. S3]QBF31512.1 hypothetical protein CFI11_09825 [Thalassococcus sp. S3]
MPPPRKLDLIPLEVRQWLAEELQARGFADIVEVTEALNFRLEEDGLQLTVGKSAVGEFSKLLKDQREAFSMAETLLGEMDVEAESDLHRMLLHMIATSAAQMMKAVREKDAHLEPKDLMSLGRMLKDLMSSAGIREKLLEDERTRLAREIKEKAADVAAKAVGDAGLSAEKSEQIKAQILGVQP